MLKTDSEPYILAEAYAEAGIGIYIVEVGVTCNLTLMDLSARFYCLSAVNDATQKFEFEYGITNSINALSGSLDVYIKLDLFFTSHKWTWELFNWTGLTYNLGFIGKIPGRITANVDETGPVSVIINENLVGASAKINEWLPSTGHTLANIIHAKENEKGSLTYFNDSIYYFHVVPTVNMGNLVYVQKIGKDAIASSDKWQWETETEMLKYKIVPTSTDATPGRVLGSCVYDNYLYVFYTVLGMKGDSSISYTTLDTDGNWSPNQMFRTGLQFKPAAFAAVPVKNGIVIYLVQQNGELTRFIGNDKKPFQSGQMDWSYDYTKLATGVADVSVVVDPNEIQTTKLQVFLLNKTSRAVYELGGSTIPTLKSIKSISTLYFDNDLYLFYITDDDTIRYQMRDFLGKWDNVKSTKKVSNAHHASWINVSPTPLGIFMIKYDNGMNHGLPYWMNYRTKGFAFFSEPDYKGKILAEYYFPNVSQIDPDIVAKTKSVRLPVGWRALTFAGRSYNHDGRDAVLIPGNIADVKNSGLQFKFLSFQIYRDQVRLPDALKYIVLYEGPEFKGNYLEIKEKQKNFGTSPFEARSIYIPYRTTFRVVYPAGWSNNIEEMKQSWNGSDGKARKIQKIEKLSD
ncbi:MAG: hypothetical protein IPL65_22515 [Lewinellaceae bacterium]|nr:hypothetical protein [Lewinellaceae bacterium]